MIGHRMDGLVGDVTLNSLDKWCYCVHSVFKNDRMGQLAIDASAISDFRIVDDKDQLHVFEITRDRLPFGIAQASVEAIDQLMQRPLLKKFGRRKDGRISESIEWQACYALRDGKMRTQDEIAIMLGRPFCNSHLKALLARLVHSGMLDNENDHEGYRLNDRGRWCSPSPKNSQD